MALSTKPPVVVSGRLSLGRTGRRSRGMVASRSAPICSMNWRLMASRRTAANICGARRYDFRMGGAAMRCERVPGPVFGSLLSVPSAPQAKRRRDISAAPDIPVVSAIRPIGPGTRIPRGKLTETRSSRIVGRRFPASRSGAGTSAASAAKYRPENSIYGLG